MNLIPMPYPRTPLMVGLVLRPEMGFRCIRCIEMLTRFPVEVRVWVRLDDALLASGFPIDPPLWVDDIWNIQREVPW